MSGAPTSTRAKLREKCALQQICATLALECSVHAIGLGQC